jgi:hypothetical protein
MELLAQLKHRGNRGQAYLADAKLFLDEVESYYTESGAFNVGAFNRLALELTHEIFKGQPRLVENPNARREQTLQRIFKLAEEAGS